MNRTRQDQLIERFGHRVRQLLNHGADELSPRTIQRLSAARSVAISRQRVGDPLLQLVPANARSAFVDDMNPRRATWALLASTFVVVAGIFFISEWHNRQAISEIAEIDSAILTDDLPIDAPADPGFIDFLKRAQ